MTETRTLRAVLAEDEQLSRRLVRAEPVDLHMLRESVREVERLWERHRAGLGERLIHASAPGAGPSSGGDEFAHEHETLGRSFEQLHWLLGIVARDDHGGNRQALGQYWALFVEAAVHHLDAESEIAGSIREERESTSVRAR